MRLLHITDTHLFAEPGRRQYGWDTRTSLSAVLAAGRALQPDLIVFGGDLAEDRAPATYRFLREQSAGIPALAIPGNHDDPAALGACFDRWPDAGVAAGGWRVHGLSSWVNGRESGRVAQQQLKNLERSLSADTAPTAVFVHHPPIPVGHSGIDAIGLENGAELLAVLDRFAHVRAIICGHAHQSFTQRHRHLLVLGTPSTCRQFGPLDGDEFSDSRMPGLRVIDLCATGELRTEVRRVPQAQLEAYRPEL